MRTQVTLACLVCDLVVSFCRCANIHGALHGPHPSVNVIVVVLVYAGVNWKTLKPYLCPSNPVHGIR